MSITVLAPQVISRDGLEPAYTTPNADGHYIANSGRMWIHFLNGSGSDCEVTIATPGTVDSLAIAEKVVDVPAGEQRLIGPFPPKFYNEEEGVTDRITVTFESPTTNTMAALILPVS